MAAKLTKSVNTLIPAKKTSAYNAELLGVREIVSKTGVLNYVLVFQDAEVIMPGTWNITEDEYPNGLYEGMRVNAYWTVDDDGNNRFHLEEVA